MFLRRIRGALAEFFLIILRSVEKRRVENKKRNRQLKLGIPSGKYPDQTSSCPVHSSAKVKWSLALFVLDDEA